MHENLITRGGYMELNPRLPGESFAIYNARIDALIRLDTKLTEATGVAVATELVHPKQNKLKRNKDKYTHG